VQAVAQTFVCGNLKGQSISFIDWGDKFRIEESSIDGENRIIISETVSGLSVLLEYKRNGAWTNSNKDGSKVEIERLKRNSNKEAWAIRHEWAGSAGAYGMTNELMLGHFDHERYSLVLTVSGNSSSIVTWQAGTYLGHCKKQS
jgi:hypothetical protein